MPSPSCRDAQVTAALRSMVAEIAREIDSSLSRHLLAFAPEPRSPLIQWTSSSKSQGMGGHIGATPWLGSSDRQNHA